MYCCDSKKVRFGSCNHVWKRIHEYIEVCVNDMWHFPRVITLECNIVRVCARKKGSVHGQPTSTGNPAPEWGTGATIVLYILWGAFFPYNTCGAPCTNNSWPYYINQYLHWHVMFHTLCANPRDNNFLRIWIETLARYIHIAGANSRNIAQHPQIAPDFSNFLFIYFYYGAK